MGISPLSAERAADTVFDALSQLISNSPETSRLPSILSMSL